ncbi:MAG: tripartite tricarboxylate transporter TctB family protein [Burkholderiales bacterium]
MTLHAVSPRTDLRTACAWIALGALIVFASWRMDRLEAQGAELYTAPGLWPGAIGLALAGLGGVLAWRSVRRARATAWDAAEVDDAQLVPPRRFALAAAMFFGYAILLVGRGLPFWLGTAVFVATFVFVFRRAGRAVDGGAGSTRGDALLAIACAVGTAFIVSVAFENLFYVRLP